MFKGACCFDIKNHCVCSAEKRGVFLECIWIFVDSGVQQDMDMLGKAPVHYESIFSSLLRAKSKTSIDEMPAQSFVRNLMNRCLIQHSIFHQSHQSIEAGKRTMTK